MANNNYQWPTERHNARKATGIHEVDAITALSAQMSSLTNMVKALNTPAGVNAMHTPGFSCVYCGDSHQYEDCPSNPASACYVANFNKGSHHYSNPHNQGMRQHPNLSWSNQGAGTSQPNAYHRSTYPPGYPPQQQRTQAVEQSSSLESLLKEFISRSEAKIQSHDAALRNLENQNAAAFPQHSGSAETSNPSGSRPPLPFPQRFQKQQQDGQFCKFLEVLKQLHINIPLVEALEQMPSYAKFMKDLMTKKHRLGEFKTVALTEECSAILQNKLPPKLKDPGSFTIPCSIGNQYFGRALCDLGASINLMPMSIFKKLGIGEARPTTVSLQLADRAEIRRCLLDGRQTPGSRDEALGLMTMIMVVVATLWTEGRDMTFIPLGLILCGIVSDSDALSLLLSVHWFYPSIIVVLLNKLLSCSIINVPSEFFPIGTQHSYSSLSAAEYS
ncbi:uncharacterized protein LOC112093694 [Morus notabilis]|uniref:uncharacterized protein LOC112093694 n=1 Tax=Morus notabilis TaxID=981085 RepID=UPI000CED269D|nr:uncharacterized protein LOC112093694 [Morus notabilis]